MENKNRKSLIWSMLFCAASSFIISSCNKADEFSSESIQTSNNESTQESTSDELDDMATTVLNSDVAASGGRLQTITDDRFICDGTTIEFSNVAEDKSSGTATITFSPNGCTDKRGNVRKGQIKIDWAGGKWYTVDATITITPTNYSINEVAIEGTRTLTTTAYTPSPLSVTWNVEASHTFTWPDTKTALRDINKTKKWEHTDSDDVYTVSNGPADVSDFAASGTNRYGNEYTIDIKTPLVYLSSCRKANKVFLPVSGVKIITNITKSKAITIDYGNGDCDNTFTVTVDGKSKTLRGKNDSSHD